MMYNTGMKIFIIITSILLFLIAMFFVVTYVCFRITFFVSKKQREPKDLFPPGEIYVPHHATMKKWMDETETFNHTDVYIKSHDGLNLHGKHYKFFENAPTEIMFHGYRGSAKRDLCGGVQRCIKLKRNVLTVDQRSQGNSQGNVITFGVKERHDVLSWIDYLIKKEGEDCEIILTGISMGATTVCLATGFDLPKNVSHVVADCGFSNAKDIIKIVIKKIGLSPKLFYPLVRLGGKIYGKFDVEQTSTLNEVKKSKTPILFLHGDADDFVPAHMSKDNFNATSSTKRLVLFKDAGHGASYLSDPDLYLKELSDFETEIKKAH